MKIADHWQTGIIITCFFVPLILTLIIDASSSMLILLLYAGFIIGGFALYKIIVEMVVKPKLKPGCLGYDLAFWASSPPTDDYRVVFNFEREEYAQAFAALNMAALEENASE